MSDYAIISWRALCAAPGAAAAPRPPAEQRCSCACLPAPSGWKGCGLACQQLIPQLTSALSALGVIFLIMQKPHLVPAGEKGKGNHIAEKGSVRIHGRVPRKTQCAVVKYTQTGLKPAPIPCGRAVFQSLLLNKILQAKLMRSHP